MAEEIVFIVNDTQETVSLFIDSGDAAGVDSFNARTGVVIPVSGDYTAAQVTNAFDTSADDTDDIVEGSTNKFATIQSITAGEPTGSDVTLNVVSLTQAEYTAGTPVATTFYIITDA